MYHLGTQLYWLLNLLLLSGCGIAVYRLTLEQLSTGEPGGQSEILQREEPAPNDATHKI